MANNELPSIDPTQLAGVTGGATASDDMTTMLQQILTSIQQLAQQNKNPMGDFMQMMPFIMMMQHSSAPAPTVIQSGPPPEADGWTRVA